MPSAGEWGILLEFPIPRRQQRIDAILLSSHLIFVLEFKSSRGGEQTASGRQAEDYALDLSYFHAPSHDRVLCPILIATGLPTKHLIDFQRQIRPLATVAPEELSSLLKSIYELEPTSQAKPIDFRGWNDGRYHPVPTIIEAATALYSGMSVREITHSHAGSENLTVTTDFVMNAIVEAQKNNEKIICFITGVPGAGKTLVGMNLAHNPDIRAGGRPSSVFMSGNGPLVKILREALARDFSSRNGSSVTEARSKVETFVQNIHHFVKDNLERLSDDPPHERAIIFDEAQRAWSAEHNRRKHRNSSDAWHISEPEMVLRIMDRHEGWAAIIALVGGGQEINDGEAGLTEWGKALQSKYPHWRVLVSPEAIDRGDSVAGTSLFVGETYPNVVVREEALHLRTSNRSHQSRFFTTWVNRVLIGATDEAYRLSNEFGQFPVLLSRNLEHTRRWLLENSRGERRLGLVASSGAARLRAHGIETSLGFRAAYPFTRWFLDGRSDVRSSFQMEVAASEFEVQGLELDLVGLCWGGDFIWDFKDKSWRVLQFSGKRWNAVGNDGKSIRIKNKYRVLMTRAREGLIIWVPKGDERDSTRSASAMDDTANYLLQCGVRPI